MTPEEIKILTEKVQNDTATPEEELELLKFLNKGVEQMRVLVKSAALKEELEK